MAADYIKCMPIVPHDQTSNQILVDIELGNASNNDLLKQTAESLKDQGWLHIYTRMVCKTLVQSSAKWETSS